MVYIDTSRVGFDLTLEYLEPWYETTAQEEGFLLGEVSIILGGDDWLLDYNRRFLNHDFYTDIITFDYVENKIVSGDLLISLDRVIDNAIELNVSRETEMNRVFIHGFLHLCGYGDKTEEETKIMREKEDYYLKLL